MKDNLIALSFDVVRVRHEMRFYGKKRLWTKE